MDKKSDGLVDEKYYQTVKSGGVAEKILIVARDRIYDDFLRMTSAAKGQTILDVGISDVINDGANVLERRYPHQADITACGIGSAELFQAEFPDVKFVPIEPNKKLPFDDGAFDIATANAVLEHVGSVENQKFFIAELTRVARKVFLTVPHRYFPVEHHTGIPFLHYNDFTFNFACKLTSKNEWRLKENLIMMTKSQLAQLSQGYTRSEIGYTGLKIGIFSSNLYLYISNE